MELEIFSQKESDCFKRWGSEHLVFPVSWRCMILSIAAPSNEPVSRLELNSELPREKLKLKEYRML